MWNCEYHQWNFDGLNESENPFNPGGTKKGNLSDGWAMLESLTAMHHGSSM